MLSEDVSQIQTPKPAARPKSPPLAFEKTSNDMLIASAFQYDQNTQRDSMVSPSASTMGRLSPGSGSEQHLQLIVDQQSNAIQLLHEAFAAERQVWSLEKERLYQRIANLERLLKTGDHYSPAKSPIISPSWGSGLVSPQPRSINASHFLPTISEDEKTPLSSRRAGAPQSISLPSITEQRSGTDGRHNSVSFTTDDGIKVEEIPASPARLEKLSPPPVQHRILAGHTPVRIPRKPTPPPKGALSEGIEDTPTRNNTHINAFLTRCNDEDNDKALKGPLNMPELPSDPTEANFTLEALSARLEQIEKDPKQSKPMIFSTPSPGLASPENELDRMTMDHFSPRGAANLTEAPFAPAATRDANASYQSTSSSVPAMSPNGAPMSPLDPAETEKFEQGGIKLKKKASVNFGAPFGQLSGLCALRKLS